MAEVLFPQLTVKRKTGSEPFSDGPTTLGFTLLSFWQWSASDLISNALRGRLAEYVIAQTLGIVNDNDAPRAEWDAFDLRYQGLKIEVKSAAYLQTWAQKKHSSINFDIAPTRFWDSATSELASVARRQADLYVFALLGHKDQATLNAMDLSQWNFYLLRTAVLDAQVPQRKQMSLATLRKLEHEECTFRELRPAIERLAELMPKLSVTSSK